MSLTRMSSRTRKNFLFCVLAIIALSIFATNTFAAPQVTNPYIPPTTPNSVLRAQVSCGYYPQADGRTVENYFGMTYNGLGFTDMGYSNSSIFLIFAKAPSAVVRFNGKAITNDATKIVNAKAGELVILPASALAYETNSLLLTFDEPRVPGGKVYFKVGFYANTKDIWVNQMDVNRNYGDSVSARTWSGPTPSGRVEGVVRTRDTIKLFGSQGLYLPVNPLNLDRTSGVPIKDSIGANFYQRVQSVTGNNSGAKSTQKLTYVLPDNTGCEAISYIEIK